MGEILKVTVLYLKVMRSEVHTFGPNDFGKVFHRDIQSQLRSGLVDPLARPSASFLLVLSETSCAS